MKRTEHTHRPTTLHRSAFTLVELLVSLTLILLIMSMFAAIFGLATDTVKVQREIAENDQVARSVFTMLKADFAKRTMRTVLPYYPTEDPATSPTPFGTRAGYVYISTNNESSSHDDLIQFTVDARLLQQSQDNTPYSGAAQLLYDVTNATDLDLRAHPNQPEADDGDLNPNGVSSSSAAEIAIFLRNGKLYRRVSLLREPLEVAGQELDLQPHSNLAGTPENAPLLIDLNSPDALGGQIGGAFQYRLPDTSLATTDDFHRHFDFSALPISTNAPLPLNAHLNHPTNAEFIGLDALNNESLSGLGNPRNRLGFNPVTGQSREHDSLATQTFLGRFLQGETSDVNYNWPLAPSTMVALAALGGLPALPAGNGNPTDIVNSPTRLLPETDIVQHFIGAGRGGVRTMEDLLLANVHELRIEIWDDALRRFVVPGYGTGSDPDAAVGDYHIRRNLQFDGVGFGYGPLTAAGVSPAVFDTWHAEITDFDGNGTPTLEESQPPFIAYQFNPPRQNDTPPGPSSPAAPPLTALGELAPSGNAPRFWHEGDSHSLGDVVYARNAVDGNYLGWDADGDGAFDWEADGAAALGVGVPLPDQGFQIAYQCVGVTTGGSSGTSGGTPPAWPTTPGRRISDGNLIWLAIDNRRPLRAVRLTLRFRAGAAENIRQMSQIIPLLDE